MGLIRSSEMDLDTTMYIDIFLVFEVGKGGRSGGEYTFTKVLIFASAYT